MDKVMSSHVGVYQFIALDESDGVKLHRPHMRRMVRPESSRAKRATPKESGGVLTSDDSSLVNNFFSTILFHLLGFSSANSLASFIEM